MECLEIVKNEEYGEIYGDQDTIGIRFKNGKLRFIKNGVCLSKIDEKFYEKVYLIVSTYYSNDILEIINSREILPKHQELIEIKK